MRILFADDNHETCELFQLGLGLNGVVVHIAHDGVEAVEVAKKQLQFLDAIVLDVEMPQMSGLDALRTIRESQDSQHIPVVIFTGYSTPEYTTRALEAGADKVVHKPMMPGELTKVLRKLIQARRDAATP